MYIYMYIHIHVYMHTYIYVYVHIYTYLYMCMSNAMAYHVYVQRDGPLCICATQLPITFLPSHVCLSCRFL